MEILKPFRCFLVFEFAYRLNREFTDDEARALASRITGEWKNFRNN